MPSDEEIRYMFSHNPHGAGYALQGDIKGDGVFRLEYHKGFMNADDLIEALGPREKLKNLTVAIHCRIKTSGETDKFTTHPFPICNQYGALRKTDGYSSRLEEVDEDWKGAVLFHNGVFTGLGGLINPNSSDTQDFVVGVANRYLKKANMPSKVCQQIVGQIVGTCRVLILYPNKKFPMLKMGTWYEHEGCWYSNMGYKQETAVTTYSGYDHYHNSYAAKRNWRTELDEWGCNIAQYAWPSEEDDWIRFDDERWKNIENAVRDREEKNGEVIVHFNSTGKKEWIFDEDMKQIYTADRREDVKLREDEEDYLIDTMENGAIYSDHGYMWFEDDIVLENWMENIAKKVGEFEYKFKGETWYVDTLNCEAYTEEGLRHWFETNEIGHVRKDLKTKGYHTQHSKDAVFDIPDDEDDVASMLGYGGETDYYGV